MNELTDEQLTELYDTFRAVPVDFWERRATVDELCSILEDEGDEELVQKFDSETLAAQLRMFGKVAHEYDRATFADAIQEDELPPIELRDEELELARGGSSAIPFFWAMTAIAKAKANWDDIKESYNEGYEDAKG